MLLRRHSRARAEPWAQLRGLLRQIRSRAMARYQSRECSAGYSADDWLQIEAELVFRHLRWQCVSR